MSANQAYDPWNVMDQGFSQAEIKEGGKYEPPRDGTYQAQITEYNLDLNKMTLKRKFKIINGEYAGKTVLSWLNFMKKDGTHNEGAFSIFKSEVAVLDKQMATLPMRDMFNLYLNAIANQSVEIYIKSERLNDNNWSSTIYINSFLNDQAAQPQEGLIQNTPF